MAATVVRPDAPTQNTHTKERSLGSGGSRCARALSGNSHAGSGDVDQNRARGTVKSRQESRRDDQEYQACNEFHR